MNGIKIKLKYEDLKEFIKITTSFESNIDIGEGNCVYDGKSLMAYYSLDLSKPFSILTKRTKGLKKLYGNTQ